MSDTHPLILQLDSSGNPQCWIGFEEAACYVAKDMVAWTVGGNDFTIHGGHNRISGSTSTMELETIIAIKGDRHAKYVHRTPSLSNRALFRRDHNLCAYCGEVFATNNLSREHIIPTSRGGIDKWTNVVTACMSCNRRKDARTPEEAHMELLYIPYVPTTAEFLLLMNRNILANQIDFLLARVSKTSRLVDAKFKQLMIDATIRGKL